MKTIKMLSRTFLTVGISFMVAALVYVMIGVYNEESPDEYLTILLFSIAMGLIMTGVMLPSFGPSLFRKMRRISNGVAGSLQVIGVNHPPTQGQTMYSNIKIIGVLSAPGIAAHEVEYQGVCQLSKWPSDGEILPVIVDVVDPRRYKILWKQVADCGDTATQLAQQRAAQMNDSRQARSNRSTASFDDRMFGSSASNGINMSSTTFNVNGQNIDPSSPEHERNARYRKRV
ncbi:MAG: hypothetical protein FWG14_04480 [Peptococcaceae bacterium]|nr:hypothetical protein [Peptococcaceae bacterium]